LSVSILTVESIKSSSQNAKMKVTRFFGCQTGIYQGHSLSEIKNCQGLNHRFRPWQRVVTSRSLFGHFEQSQFGLISQSLNPSEKSVVDHHANQGSTDAHGGSEQRSTNASAHALGVRDP